MHWAIVALIAPLLWSTLNHADKYLISKYSRHTGIGGLAILSCLFALVPLPIIDTLNHAIVYTPSNDIFPLIATGILMALAVLLYLYALDRDDASHVVPFWFLVPVFAYLLGIVLLGETLESAKIVGSIITLMGAFILSLEFEEGFAVKKVTAFLMICSSLCIALSDAIFKLLTDGAPFWHSIFWNQVGIALFGIACFIFVKKYRRDFIKVVSIKKKEVVALNVGGEVIQTGATIINYYSTLLAPVSLVLLISYTFQPLFVFVEGVLLTYFFPHIVKERMNRHHVIQKLAAITIMGIGVYLVVAA